MPWKRASGGSVVFIMPILWKRSVYVPNKVPLQYQYSFLKEKIVNFDICVRNPELIPFINIQKINLFTYTKLNLISFSTFYFWLKRITNLFFERIHKSSFNISQSQVVTKLRSCARSFVGRSGNGEHPFPPATRE